MSGLASGGHGPESQQGSRQGADPLAPPAGLTGGGLVEFSTRRRVTVAMFWITMFLFGVIALWRSRSTCCRT